MKRQNSGWISPIDPNYKKGLTKIKFSKKGLTLYKKWQKTMIKALKELL